jgi:hypothetical protein
VLDAPELTGNDKPLPFLIIRKDSGRADLMQGNLRFPVSQK